MNLIKKYSVIIIFLLFSVFSFSQKTDGFDFDGGIISSSLDSKVSFYIGAKYNYWFNPYIGGTVGGMFSHSNIDMSFTPPHDNLVTYDIYDNIINLTGNVGIKLSTPTFKGLGMASDLIFLFEPIPFNSVSVEKNIFDSNSNLIEENSKNRMVFTKFNPGYNIEMSIFYEVKKNNKKMRFALGGGITSFNPYNTYYQTDIDNIKLKEHLKLKPNDLSKMIFIRVSGIN